MGHVLEVWKMLQWNYFLFWVGLSFIGLLSFCASRTTCSYLVEVLFVNFKAQLRFLLYEVTCKPSTLLWARRCSYFLKSLFLELKMNKLWKHRQLRKMSLASPFVLPTSSLAKTFANGQEIRLLFCLLLLKWCPYREIDKK